jgi:hypothetical protein
MEECEKCQGLHGLGTLTDPHDELKMHVSNLQSDGTLEQYKCLTCETSWARLRAAPEYRGKHQFWAKL